MRLSKRCVYRYTDPKPTYYASRRTYAEGEALPIDGSEIAVADILPGA